jgi:D-alanyl-D-alanine carboxypeptidase/D-alanyl-D-alanine-endopeptidase (penicillin-binding protein 4)
MRNIFISLGWLIALFHVDAQGFIERAAPEAQIGFYAKNISSGEILRNHNPEKLLIPASTLKLLTTATALKILGKDFQYSTTAFLDGTIENEVLNGDLIVFGSGDPTFGSALFSQNSPELILSTIKDRLTQNGIKRLNGKIIVDCSALGPVYYPSGRLWDDMANYYGATPSGLSWRDNSFEIDLSSPQKPGQHCTVKQVRPTIEGVEFLCSVVSASNTKDSAYIYGFPGMPIWEIRGSIPVAQSNFTIKGALPNPALQFAKELANILADDKNKIEIVVTDKKTDINKQILKPLVTFQSPYLHEIIKVVNQRSHNLMADHLYLMLASDSLISPWVEAGKLVNKFWSGKGVDGPKRILDGSGISTKNLISPRFMVDLLCEMSQDVSGPIFESSLAVGGKSGTLSRMWIQPNWNGRVVAKSGSMEGVLCYAGYVYSKANRKIAFSIMVNNYICPASEIRKCIETEIGRLIDEN